MTRIIGDRPWPQAMRRGSHRGAGSTLVLAGAAALALLHAQCGFAVPLAVYGNLPSLEDVALSPSGTRIAFVHTDGDARMIGVVSFSERKVIGTVRVGRDKLRGIGWADDDNLLLSLTTTALPVGFIGFRAEWSTLEDYNVKSRRLIVLPQPLHDPNYLMMNIVAGSAMVRDIDGHTVLFIPGVHLAQASEPVLIRYDLETGGERIFREGSPTTQSWLVDSAGHIVASEDYDERAQRWSIWVGRGGEDLREAASGKAGIEFPSLLGFGPSPNTLLVQSIEDGNSAWRLMSMTDGSLGPPMAEHRVLNAPIEDRTTHRMIGGVHVADRPQYVFFDPDMEARWESIIDSFAGESVEYVSSSADLSRIVILVEGPRYGYRYVLVDMNNHSAASLGEVYQGVTAPLEVRRMTYAAADGMRIPAYLTLPAGRPAKDLPLVVLPHGGPAARDTAQFDWWSQALADQGYAVLRPNYRGSSLTWQFLSAGFGQWGRKMQTDLSDGVQYLAAEGLIDPKRVCIVGASYGGYAALAGVTLQHGVYRCAVSVAGISDLAEMLKHYDPGLGSSRTIRYWDRFWAVSGPADPALDAISPIKHVAAVDVPVLLIHGRDDTVVPYGQSEEMLDALRAENKNVQLVTLSHEDHWLTHGDTRLQMLESTVDFLRKYNPPS